MATLTPSVKSCQLTFMNKYREVLLVKQTDISVSSGHALIEKDKYELLDSADISRPLQVKLSGTGSKNVVLSQGNAIPGGLVSRDAAFDTDEGCIFLGSSTDGSVGYVIIGTGDFRNINSRFWVWDLAANPDFYIECTGDFQLTIHSTNDADIITL